MREGSLRRRSAQVVGRCLQSYRNVLYRAVSTARIAGSPRRNQPIHAVGLGSIRCESGVEIGVALSPFFYSSYAYLEARNTGASITIGENTLINNDFCAVAEHTSVVIGRNCLIGTRVQMFDSDFHGLKLSERRTSRAEWAAPVVVGDDVFIGANVTILKGVSIGNGSVIASGSLVTKDVPAGMIAAGVPAVVVRAID